MRGHSILRRNPSRTGGLVRAYTQATQSAIAESERVTVSVCVDITLRIAYPLYDQMVRIAAECNAKTLDTQYADAVTLTLRMLDGTQTHFWQSHRTVPWPGRY